MYNTPPHALLRLSALDATASRQAMANITSKPGGVGVSNDVGVGVTVGAGVAVGVGFTGVGVCTTDGIAVGAGVAGAGVCKTVGVGLTIGPVNSIGSPSTIQSSSPTVHSQ